MNPLAKGSRVGAWRVKAFQGLGSYGAVYRAERVGFRRSEPGALKASLSAWDWRMKREVELLSRLNHPGIPRLLDRGGPRSPSGKEYPFFVMEWVEGPRLYAWAEQYAPSAEQVYRVLAHLARALEAAVGEEERAERSKPPERARAWKPWVALAAAGACAVLQWHSQPVGPPPGPTTAPDAGTAAVGDTAPRAASSPATEQKPLAQEPPPEPRPGQLRPDKKGRCPDRKQVPINGGCWNDVSSSMDAQSCAASGHVLYQGKCLVPANEPPRKPQPTSNPPEER